MVARQGLGKYVSAATNTHATIEELLGAVFSMGSMSQIVCSERKVGDYFFTVLLVVLLFNEV
jgi:hypothetical protein